MRSSLKGLTSYSMHAQSGSVVFASGSKLHSVVDPHFTVSDKHGHIPYRMNVYPEFNSAT